MRRAMQMRRLRMLATLVAVCLLWVASAAVAGVRDFQVRYVSADYVYLDGGAADGLTPGDTLRISRGNKVTTVNTTVVVEHASEHSAACQILATSQPVRTGDTARSLADDSRPALPSAPVVAPDTVAVQQSVRPRAETRTRWADVSGYTAFQWYRFDDAGSSGLRHDQPTLRFSLKARQLWGKQLTFYAKGRARHDVRQRFGTSVSADEWNNRIYAFALTYGVADGPLTWQVGRLLSNALAPTGPVDGALIEGRLSSVFRAGAFGGTLPDERDNGPGSSFVKYGLFVSAVRGNFGGARWSTIAAATAEYHGSTVSRQYVYQQSDWQSGRRWSLYEGVEIDLNNGWRRAEASSAASLTNARVSVGYRPIDRASVTVSYDNRRNYRTWQTRSVADSLFDTAFRNGLRTNAHLGIGNGWSVSGNVGGQLRHGETKTTWSWGGSVACSDFLLRRMFMTSQVSGFSGPWASGVNPSLTLRQAFGSGHQFSLAGGAYIYSSDVVATRRTSRWARVDATRYVTARCYVNGQFEHDWGDEPRGNRIQAEAGITF